MAISDKLLEINQVKQDIKQAIEDKGVAMSGVPFTNYPLKISEISGGGGGSSLLFTDDLEQAQKAKEVFAMSDKVNNLNNVWEDYKRTPELKYDLNLTYVTELMGFFDVYSGDSVLTQLYNDCVNEVLQVNELYTIDNQIFPKLALAYQGDYSSLLDWPTPLYVFGSLSQTLPEEIMSSTIFLSDLTPFGMGVGISLLAFPGLEFTNIEIFKQYENYEQGLIADLSEVAAFPAIQNADFPLCIVDNVEEIGGYAFSGWTENNYPLVIPDSVTSIGDSAFRNWTSNNQPLVIGNSVTSIGDNAFNYWESNHQPLVIPDSVTSIGVSAFQDWSNVLYIEMKSETPPILADTSALFTGNNAPIYVPDASVTAYKNATNWSALASRIFPISEK